VPIRTNLDFALKSGNPTARLYKDFLDVAGVELTSLGLITTVGKFDHPRSLSIDRRKHSASFRHPELFRGVNRIVFQQAQALRLHGEAQAVAVVPLQLGSEFEVVDIATDWPWFDWSEPDLAVIGISYIGDLGGCVIASSGLVIGDAYTGITGARFPGGEENETVLNNLISVLQPRPFSVCLSEELDVHRLVQSIERNLLEVIRAVFGPEWPDCIDPAIREKADRKQAAEKGRIVWWAYLDLSDHINTIRKNFSRFSALFEKCGFPSSRNKFESEILRTGKLIELRILDSHVTKRIIMEHRFSAPELTVLNEVNQNVIRLWHAAKGLQ
jgi:hypothetical protein